MKKIIIFIALLCIPMVMACKDIYDPGENVVIEDIIETIGEGADCNISVYRNNTLIVNAQMIRHGLSYQYDAGEMELGGYVGNIECNLSNSTFLGQCNFTVGGRETMNYVAIAVFFIGLVFILFKLSETVNLQFFGFNFIKPLIALVVMWLMLPLINLSLIIAESQGYRVENTLNGVYSAVTWINIFITGMYMVGLMFFAFKKMAGADEN